MILKESLAEWIQKHDPYICCLQETHLKTRDTNRLKVKGCKKIFHANRDQKKAGVAVLISDKIDFEIKTEKRQRRILHNNQRINPRRRYNNYKYICTQHKSTTICRQMLTSMKGEINNNTIMVGDFNTPVTLWIDQLNRKLTWKHKL